MVKQPETKSAEPVIKNHLLQATLSSMQTLNHLIEIGGFKNLSDKDLAALPNSEIQAISRLTRELTNLEHKYLKVKKQTGETDEKE